MTPQDLSRLATLGEGAFLEFKNRVPRPERMAKEVIAFANTRGGRVLVGVDDDGSIVGLRDAIEEEFALRHALDVHVEPPVEVQVERVHLDTGREVIVVTVPESPRKPHFLVEDDGRAASSYVRVKHMSVEAGEELVDYMRQEEAGQSVSFAFGDNEQLLMRYLGHYGQITATQLAEMTSLSGEEASATLIRLARADVLRIHQGEQQVFYTLAYDLDE